MKRETLIKQIESKQLKNIQRKFTNFKSTVTGGFKRKCSICNKK